MDNLDLIPLNDLLEALNRRFEHWIFSGIQTAIGGKDKILTVRKWNGNNATCSGLASMLQGAIYQKNMEENELDGDEDIL